MTDDTKDASDQAMETRLPAASAANDSWMQRTAELEAVNDDLRSRLGLGEAENERLANVASDEKKALAEIMQQLRTAEAKVATAERDALEHAAQKLDADADLFSERRDIAANYYRCAAAEIRALIQPSAEGEQATVVTTFTPSTGAIQREIVAKPLDPVTWRAAREKAVGILRRSYGWGGDYKSQPEIPLIEEALSNMADEIAAMEPDPAPSAEIAASKLPVSETMDTPNGRIVLPRADEPDWPTAFRLLRQSYTTLAFAFRRLHESARSRDGELCLDSQKVRAEIETFFKTKGVKL